MNDYYLSLSVTIGIFEALKEATAKHCKDEPFKVVMVKNIDKQIEIFEKLRKEVADEIAKKYE